MNNKELGDLGERLAAEFLEKSGFRIVERNFRCRFGEMDLIILSRNLLIFVEVKTRRSFRYGLPSEAVNKRKQSNYYLLASYYTRFQDLGNLSCRFDVIEVMFKPDGSHDINHIADAF